MKPYGFKEKGHVSGSVFLHLEEYEAIRLCDHEGMNHHQAAMIMNISRPTLTRIYASARRKMAEALVLGLQIVIEGGKVYYDSEWFSCGRCGCYFNNPDKERLIEYCPLCGSHEVAAYSAGNIPEEELFPTSGDVCICINCGYEKAHGPGHRCKDETCPECHHHMVRKGAPHEMRNRKSR